jgi:hypothetical protein
MNTQQLSKFIKEQGYTPCPEADDCYLNAEGFPKTTRFYPDQDIVGSFRDELHARVEELLDELLLSSATSVASTGTTSMVFSFSQLAEEFKSFECNGEEMGIERAFLLIGQLLLGRPLGWNIPEYAQQVSWPPLPKEFKKTTAMHVEGIILSKLSKIETPKGKVFFTSFAEQHAAETSCRAGARHNTRNTLVSLSEQDWTLEVKLVSASKPKSKPSTPKKSSTVQKPAGGGGGKPKSSGVAQ